MIELFVWAVLEFCAPLFIVSYSFVSFISSYYFDSLTETVNIWVLRINFQKTFPETLIFIPKNVNIYSTFFWQLQRTRRKIISIIQLEVPLSIFFIESFPYFITSASNSSLLIYIRVFISIIYLSSWCTKSREKVGDFWNPHANRKKQLKISCDSAV